MEKVRSGKVRDIYEYESGYPNELCFVATDRVSALDSVIPGLEISGKGLILTELSAEWAEWLDEQKGTALETAYVTFEEEQLEELEAAGIDSRTAQSQLALEMIPVEAIVRGYITGSLWDAYKKGEREICGLTLPDGLKECDKLPAPIFTPTTKAPVGQHDENLTFDQMVKVIENAELDRLPGYEYDAKGLAETVREYALEAYRRASEYAEKRGIIIADTKFELGLSEDCQLLFGDEFLTPDSTRFWRKKDYAPGRPQNPLDKQIIRDYVKEQREQGVTDIVVPQAIIYEVQDAYEWILNTLFPYEY